MDQKAHSNRENPPDRPRKGWRFFFGGGSEATAENGRLSGQSGDPYALSLASVGKTLWLAGFQGKGGMNRLLGMGLAPGISLVVINSQASGSVLVAIGDNRIALGAEMAANILVSDRPKTNPEIRSHLGDFAPGSEGCVVGYDKVMRGYKGKLLAMGLTPGTKFTVIRVAPLGDPIEIQVRGFHLSLRKQEADALVVEKVNPETES